MGEIDAIETAIDTLVALNLDDLDQLAVQYAQMVAISVLLAAYTDADVDALDLATLKAELKNAIDCIEKLIDKETADYIKRYSN